MEALGAGAVVLPFAILGLQSIKVLCDVLSSAKEGREQVSQAQRHVQSLLSTLERLSRRRVIDEALAAKINACADDIEQYAKKLKSLAVDDADPRLERQWKRIKILFNEKDLAKMSAVMVGHTVALSLHLNTIDR